MRVANVVGTRPQLIKAAALRPALSRRHRDVFIDTGQHWDDSMAGAFFEELDLGRPDYSLGIGGGGHGDQTGRMLVALEPILADERPDAVIVYGDTNSTLAGSLTAVKLGLPLAHVEAGLRSFDRRMPEEINRIVADHLASWCLAPTPTAVTNLADEGIVDGVTLVGDLMQDLAARVGDEVRSPAILGPIGEWLAGLVPGIGPISPGRYVLATIHRAENREPAAIRGWLQILERAAEPDRPVLLLLHPGTAAAIKGAGIPFPAGVWVAPPAPYRTTLALQLHAAAVITDSGGIQRECAWLDTPCLVLRSSTEWIEAVAASQGRMVVVGLDSRRVADELERLVAVDPVGQAERRALSFALRPAGAGEAIVAALDRGPA